MQQENVPFKPRVTQILIAINCVVFAIELILGVSEDGEGLFALGAVLPSAVLAGGWWRILTAQFLHFGALHILFNMLGLNAMGPFVEWSLGRVRFALLYLITGACALSGVVALYHLGFIEDQLLIGASGGIMASVGMTAAILQWLKAYDRSGHVKRRLKAIGQIVVLQAIIDITVPHISFTAHTTGLISGYLLTHLVLFERKLRREAARE